MTSKRQQADYLVPQGAAFVPVRKKGKLPGQCVTATYEKEYGNVRSCAVDLSAGRFNLLKRLGLLRHASGGYCPRR